MSAKPGCVPALIAPTGSAVLPARQASSPRRCASRRAPGYIAPADFAAVDAVLDRVRAMLWRLTH
ncbi:MAG: hypothetical protein E6J90_05030 [Deltaproteobacteria bacterium]|nr:MAG: hypothetical protein E6J90_05030 [Deltaproteobacteria bacterium]